MSIDHIAGDEIMNGKLKPCPFCGAKARVGIYLGRRAVACSKCPALMLGMDALWLIYKWNDRDTNEMMMDYRRGADMRKEETDVGSEV